MTEQTGGSAVPRRRLGRMLADARETAGVTIADAAKFIQKSSPTLSRIENGRTTVRAPEVKELCARYKTSPEMTDAMVDLAEQTAAPSKGWWAPYGDAVPNYFDLYVGLESAARSINVHQTELVPGLFQTESYARTLIAADNTDPDDIERRIQLRVQRQAILTRPIDPPAMRVVLRETVLRVPVGGPQIMAAQLARLASVSDLPNVEVRVVPFSAGFHHGLLAGSFSLLRPALNGHGEEREPSTVYSDLYTGALYLDKPDEVARYGQAFEKVWGAALGDDESRAALREASEEMRNG